MENKEMKVGGAVRMRKCMVMVLALCMVLGSAVAVSANEVTVDPVTSTDWQPVIDSMTAQISVTTVVAVLAVIASACVGLVFMWWGVRKATRALMAAFQKGKIKV